MMRFVPLGYKSKRSPIRSIAVNEHTIEIRFPVPDDADIDIARAETAETLRQLVNPVYRALQNAKIKFTEAKDSASPFGGKMGLLIAHTTDNLRNTARALRGAHLISAAEETKLQNASACDVISIGVETAPVLPGGR